MNENNQKKTGNHVELCDEELRSIVGGLEYLELTPEMKEIVKKETGKIPEGLKPGSLRGGTSPVQ